MSVNLSDIDLLQDYEKDSRAAVIMYAFAETEILGAKLRALIHKTRESASKSQKMAANLILARGDRP